MNAGTSIAAMQFTAVHAMMLMHTQQSDRNNTVVKQRKAERTAIGHDLSVGEQSIGLRSLPSDCAAARLLTSLGQRRHQLDVDNDSVIASRRVHSVMSNDESTSNKLETTTELKSGLEAQEMMEAGILRNDVAFSHSSQMKKDQTTQDQSNTLSKNRAFVNAINKEKCPSERSASGMPVLPANGANTNRTGQWDNQSIQALIPIPNVSQSTTIPHLPRPSI